MNKFLFIAAILAALFAVYRTAWAGPETVTIKVEGMSCPHCTERVSQAVKTIPGVDSVAVSLDDKTAVVVFDGKKTNIKALEKAIAGAGYNAGSTKTDNPHKCTDCAHAKGAHVRCGEQAAQTPCGQQSTKAPCRSAKSGCSKKAPCCGDKK